MHCCLLHCFFRLSLYLPGAELPLLDVPSLDAKRDGERRISSQDFLKIAPEMHSARNPP
jgi:hypothetical protein